MYMHGAVQCDTMYADVAPCMPLLDAYSETSETSSLSHPQAYSMTTIIYQPGPATIAELLLIYLLAHHSSGMEVGHQGHTAITAGRLLHTQHAACTYRR
jgi:hypothetical protein